MPLLKKAEGRRQKEKLYVDSLRQATSCLQTPNNFKHHIDSGVLNSQKKR
ncbi:MAG: hypothetical protein F6K39_07940 [Okeania sp. SIO3B3]|nr:hypothetical protein [Okeania sp. SIO3B3]